MKQSLDEITVSNLINWDELEIRQYPLRKITKNTNKKIHALDTETLKGYCKLLADNTGNYILNPNLKEILDYLTQLRFRNSHNFFYNLNYDINSIIKFLPKENIIELAEINKTKIYGYSLFYLPKKLFKITYKSHTYKYYDIAQFFNTSLEKASKKYLNLNKYQDNYLELDGKKLGMSNTYWDENLNMIIDYCINDCKLTYKLALLLNNTIINAIKLYPNSYISKAGITKDYMRKTVNLPDITKIPNGALKFAFNSYRGGRFEIVEKGNVGNCELYDINSAYPYHIKNLLDINKGEWKRVTSLNENADYGFYFIDTYTKYNKISPLSYMLPNKTLCYPMINCNTYISKDELLTYEKYLDYEILLGWEFYAKEKVYPFENYIDSLYKWKQNANKNNFEYDLFKILMNSGYGCFYEKNKRDNRLLAGKLFNPIYASLITANTRIQLFNFAMQDINNFVGFATDSVLFKGKHDFENLNNLGKWKLEKSGKTLVLKSGMYKIDNTLKSRGIRKTENLKTPYGNFKDIVDYIENKPYLHIYPILTTHPLSYKEVLQHCLIHEIDDINIFYEGKYKIDINRDFKRIWDNDFKNGIDLLDNSIQSKPLIFA